MKPYPHHQQTYTQQAVCMYLHIHPYTYIWMHISIIMKENSVGDLRGVGGGTRVEVMKFYFS